MARPAVIKSPKATQVKKLYVPNGQRVRKGDLLLELFDYEEQKIIAQIDRAIAENQAKLAEATGPRTAGKINKLVAISSAKIDAVTQAQKIYEIRQEQERVGQITLIEVLKARLDIALKTYQSLQSAIESELYELNLTDSLGVFKTIGLLLDSEKKYVQGCITRLAVKAPHDGVFSTSITTGSPVRLGHVLGQIA